MLYFRLVLGTSLLDPMRELLLTYRLGALGEYTVNLKNPPLLPGIEQKILEQFLTEAQQAKEHVRKRKVDPIL